VKKMAQPIKMPFGMWTRGKGQGSIY